MCNVPGEPKPFQCSTNEKTFPTNADLQRLFALMEDLVLVNGYFIGDRFCLFSLVEDFSGLIELTRTVWLNK